MMKFMAHLGASAFRAGCLFIIFFPLLFLPACSTVVPRTDSSAATKEVADDRTAIDRAEVAELFGIEIVALRQSAAGHMIDFRYKVVDLDKAMPFFREDTKPYLVDQSSGQSLSVPVPAKLGPMRPTGRNPKKGVVYWMFFGNPGVVKSGEKVTLVVGDYRLENLTVE